eukprot:607925-Prymnesium_polylepis.1
MLCTTRRAGTVDELHSQAFHCVSRAQPSRNEPKPLWATWPSERCTVPQAGSYCAQSGSHAGDSRREVDCKADTSAPPDAWSDAAMWLTAAGGSSSASASRRATGAGSKSSFDGMLYPVG